MIGPGPITLGPILFVPDDDFTTSDIDEVIRSSLCAVLTLVLGHLLFNVLFYFLLFLCTLCSVYYDFMIIVMLRVHFGTFRYLVRAAEQN